MTSFNHRKSVRLAGYDYTQEGAYFITFVTNRREPVLASIEEGQVNLTPIGMMVQNEWERLAIRFKNIDIGDFVVMPTHLYGILVIRVAGVKDFTACVNGLARPGTGVEWREGVDFTEPRAPTMPTERFGNQ